MNDETVLPVDFGKDRRDAARLLGRLLGLVEERDAEILADPVTYWKLAMDEVMRLRAAIEAAQEAGHPPFDVSWSPTPGPLPPLETIVVRREDWDALMRMRAILEGVDLRGPAGAP